MISTVAVDPFKFQSVTVQSVKPNKSPGTYRTVPIIEKKMYKLLYMMVFRVEMYPCLVWWDEFSREGHIKMNLDIPRDT